MLVIINNSMVMATMDRMVEIGMMRAIGAQRRFVRAMYMLETIALTLLRRQSSAPSSALPSCWSSTRSASGHPRICWSSCSAAAGCTRCSRRRPSSFARHHRHRQPDRHLLSGAHRDADSPRRRDAAAGISEATMGMYLLIAARNLLQARAGRCCWGWRSRS